MRNKNIESLEDVRSRMLAEQTVARMDARMRIKLGWEAKDGLVKALTKVANADGLLFGDQPFRQMPPRWSLDWMVSRATLRWKTFWRSRHSDKPRLEDYEDASAFSETFYAVKRSGAVGFIIALGIALAVGMTGLGKPAELDLQIARNAVRQTAASGDIIIVAKDERSAKLFGGLPWARRFDAQLVDKLRIMGASRIVYNVIMADPSNPVDDAKLAAAFDRAEGLVWLGAQRGEISAQGTVESVLPTALFKKKTRQAHGNLWFNMFGQIEYIPGNVMIDGRLYPSQADALAGFEPASGAIKPDYAIDYKTIPTVSATDLMLGRVKPSAIAGKSVLVAVVSDLKNDAVPIAGRGMAAVGYSWVVAAETIRHGAAIDKGFIVPLGLVALLGLWSLMQPSLAQRLPIFALALAAVPLHALGGDQIGFHYDMVPALLALLLFTGRQLTRGNMALAMTTNPISGLPGFAHLKKIKGHKSSAVVVVQIQDFDEAIKYEQPYAEKALVLAIAARINIIAPDSLIHQGKDGTFAFLVGPDNDCNIALLDQQLRALFTLDIVSLRELRDFNVLISIFDDLSQPVDIRLVLATDRLGEPVFSGLRVV